MPKKGKKVVNVKPMTNRDAIQIDIKKELDNEKKMNPNKIFDGYGSKTTKKKKTKAPPKIKRY